MIFDKTGFMKVSGSSLNLLLRIEEDIQGHFHLSMVYDPKTVYELRAIARQEISQILGEEYPNQPQYILGAGWTVILRPEDIKPIHKCIAQALEAWQLELLEEMEQC